MLVDYMMKRILLIGLIIFVIGHSAQSLAGEIAPGLAAEISKADPGKKIKVLISPIQPAAGSLKAKLSQSYKTQAEKHRAGIISLKSNAEVSQAGLTDLLGRLELVGKVSNLKNHWIINVISADISVSEIENIARRDDVERIFLFPEIRTVEPIESSFDLKAESRSSIETNLTVIGADSAWSLG
jgi:hypothetical protein